MSESVVLEVNGMKCGGCESNVTGKLTGLAGVISVKADHKAKQVAVSFDPAKTNIDTITQTIIAAGFEVN